MTNIPIRDGHGTLPRYLKASGEGTDVNPFVPIQEASLNDSSGNSIDGSNPFPVRELSASGGGNSTKVNLLADSEFTGDWFDALHYSVIIVSVKSDVVSATDGLSIEFSSDGVAVLDEDVFTILANTGKTFSFQPARRYVRIHYVNGGNDQAFFDLEVTYKADYVKPSSHRIQDPISTEDDAELVTNVNKAERPDGSFVNIGASRSNNLQITDAESSLAISKGEVEGHGAFRKFGRLQDAGLLLTTIWNENTLKTYRTLAQGDSIFTLSSTSANDTGILLSNGVATGGSITTIEDSVASWVTTDGIVPGDFVINDTTMYHGVIINATDTVLTVYYMTNESITFVPNSIGDTYRIARATGTGSGVAKVRGVDIDYLNRVEYVILNGLAGVNTVNPYYRMDRGSTEIHGSLGWNDGIIYAGTGTITAGKPAVVETLIEATTNQTLQAFMTVRAGQTGYVVGGTTSVGSGKESEISGWTRQPGQGFKVKELVNIFETPIDLISNVPFPIVEKTDIELRSKGTSSAGINVSASIDMILVDND